MASVAVVGEPFALDDLPAVAVPQHLVLLEVLDEQAVDERLDGHTPGAGVEVSIGDRRVRVGNLAFAREQLTVFNTSFALANRLYDEAKTRRDIPVVLLRPR